MKYCTMYTHYWTQSIFVKYILLHIHGSCPTRVQFLHAWADPSSPSLGFNKELIQKWQRKFPSAEEARKYIDEKDDNIQVLEKLVFPERTVVYVDGADPDYQKLVLMYVDTIKENITIMTLTDDDQITLLNNLHVDYEEGQRPVMHKTLKSKDQDHRTEKTTGNIKKTTCK